jgi:hypothetical protein
MFSAPVEVNRCIDEVGDACSIRVGELEAFVAAVDSEWAWELVTYGPIDRSCGVPIEHTVSYGLADSPEAALWGGWRALRRAWVNELVAVDEENLFYNEVAQS